MLTLTLDGQLVDLPADADVALSYQVHNLHDVESRESAFSEQFTLPRTNRNLRVLEVAHSLDSESQAPYRLVPAVLEQNGLVLLEGTAFLERSADGFDVILAGKGAELFALVGDKPLRSLDLSALNHAYTFAQVKLASSYGMTQGYFYPIVDDGRFTNREVNLDGATVQFSELNPAVYSDTVLRQLVREALPGWRVTGSLLEQPTYQRHVLPSASPYPVHRAGYVEVFQASAASDVLQSAVAPARDIVFPIIYFQDRVTDPNNRLVQVPGNATSWLLPAEDTDYTVKLRLNVRLNGDAVEPGEGSTPQAIIRVVEDGRGIVQQSVLFEGDWKSGFTTLNKRVNLDFTVRRGGAGQQVYVQMFLRDGMSLTVLPGATISFEALPRVYPPSLVHVDASLPATTQGDFLRLLFTQFNVIPQVDAVAQTLRLDVFNDVLDNLAAERVVDWSGKVDFSQRPELTYALDNTGQRTEFVYADTSEEYDGTVASDLGLGALSVPNYTLPQQVTAYESAYALAENHPAFIPPVTLPWLPYYSQQDGKDSTEWVIDVEYPADFYVTTPDGQLWHSKKPAVRPPVIPPAPWRISYGAEPGSNPFTLTIWEAVPLDALYSEQSPPPFVGLVLPAPALPGLLIGGEETDTPFTPTQTLTADGLRFTELLPGYYAPLQAILDRALILSLGIRLSTADIAQLDFTVPVRLDIAHWPGHGPLQAEFYLNLIDQYQPGATVRCELVCLNSIVRSHVSTTQVKRIFDYTFDKTFN